MNLSTAVNASAPFDNSAASTGVGSTTSNASTSVPVDHFPWEQIITVLPELLGFLLLGGVILFIGPRQIASALGRVKRIAIAGLEIELAEDVQAAATSKNVDVTAAQALRAARILSEAAPILACARLLWVDDEPANNIEEMRALRRLCVSIDLAPTTEAAREALKKGVYDLVISDMRRGTTERAGEEILGDATEAPLSPDIIYYVGVKGPVPAGAFGLTVKPDELFQLVVNALRQRRG